MNNVDQTIISQYANSPTIVALIESLNSAIDPSADIDNFYNTVWNLSTAIGFGLDIWGRILGVGRNIVYTPTQSNFGFDEAFTNVTDPQASQPFEQAPFYDGVPASSTITLADDAYRTLLFVKALANICDCTPQALNALLTRLFAGRGRCYVTDSGGMSMQYVFEFALQPFELAIIAASGVVPRPAGVLANVLQFNSASTFGFQEAGGQPFDNGVFLSDNGITQMS